MSTTAIHRTLSFAAQTATHKAKPARNVVGQQGAAKSPSADQTVRRKMIKGDCRRLRCPHCQNVSATRTSTQITPLMTESIYSCSNPECGHTFVARTEIVHTLSPSATPNPSIRLPLSKHIRRDLIKAAVEYSPEADHTPQFTQPVNGDLFAGGTPTD